MRRTSSGARALLERGRGKVEATMAQTIGTELGKQGANLNGVRNGAHSLESKSSRHPAKTGSKSVETKKARAKTNEKAPRTGGKLRGLAVDRHFTTRGVDPLDSVTWERRTSVIN